MPTIRDVAMPYDPQPLFEDRIYAAVKSFVCQYGLPALDAGAVYQGWQNRSALPAGSEEYAVISIFSDLQRGTPVTCWAVDEETEEGRFSVRGLVEVLAQVDFCSNTDAARARARRLAVMTRTEFAVSHFRQWGMSALYAEDVKDLSFVGDAAQFVRRYMTTLHLSLWEGTSVAFDWFDRVEPRIEDVDAYHPNRGE